jgi:energy-coupling factor transporter ATP-binding protein EcfA2
MTTSAEKRKRPPRKPARSGFEVVLPKKPVVLRELHVEHLRVLGDVLLKFDLPRPDRGQWIVFLGPNGTGKTTLLRSLALALRNLSDPRIWPKGTFGFDWHANNGPREATITVRLAHHGEHVTRIRANGSESFSQSPRQGRPRLFPLFAYGCHRGSALGGWTREVDLGDDDGPEVATLFSASAPLIHAETWLITWDGDAQKNERSRRIFDAVQAALVKLLALESIEVRDKGVVVSGPNVGQNIPLGALSDGYVSTAGWFLDLVARWIDLAERHMYPIAADFLEHMTGLVLLDEIDLHLHPRWQVDAIARTRELLPRMSFVVTTHNPLMLVGAKPEEIWILSSDGGKVRAERGSEWPMLLTGGQIYSRYFGIRDIYPSEVGRKLRRYSFLSGYALRDDGEQAEMESLREELRKVGVAPGWKEVARAPLPGEKPSGKATRTKVRRKAT